MLRPDRSRAAIGQAQDIDFVAAQAEVFKSFAAFLHADHAKPARLVRPAGLVVVALALAHIAAGQDHGTHRNPRLHCRSDEPAVGGFVILMRVDDHERGRQRVDRDFGRGSGQRFAAFAG